jgi:DNA-binding MarR family transcriptional regulator
MPGPSAVSHLDQLGQLIEELRVSKQVAGQLVRTLAVRGYLDCSVDESDRRKTTVALTERGRAAATIQKTAKERIDAELVSRVGQDSINCTRSTLTAMVEIGRNLEA